MKAAIFDGVGRPLRIGDLSVPEPAADEVLLHVAACGICGSDLHMTKDPVTFGVGQGTVLGHEFAGDVTMVGADVADFQVGDRVAVAPMWGCGSCESCSKGEPAWCSRMRLIGGGYAEFAAVAARQCRRLPDDLPIDEGALAEPVSVALHAIVRSGMKPGDKVLVLGAGPIGLLVAFWARRMGAGAVIVADITRHQEARAAAFGATGFAISGPSLEAELQRYDRWQARCRLRMRRQERTDRLCVPVWFEFTARS